MSATVLEQQASHETAADVVTRLRASFDSGRTRPLELPAAAARGAWAIPQGARGRDRAGASRRHGAPIVRGVSVGDRADRCRAGARPKKAKLVDQAGTRLDGDGLPAGPQLYLSRAAGRRADHRTVELSASASAVAAGRSDRGRECRGGEAERAGAGHQPLDRQAPAGIPGRGVRERRRGRRRGDDGVARRAIRSHFLYRRRNGRPHRDACRGRSI